MNTWILCEQRDTTRHGQWTAEQEQSRRVKSFSLSCRQSAIRRRTPVRRGTSVGIGADGYGHPTINQSIQRKKREIHDGKPAALISIPLHKSLPRFPHRTEGQTLKITIPSHSLAYGLLTATDLRPCLHPAFQIDKISAISRKIRASMQSF